MTGAAEVILATGKVNWQSGGVALRVGGRPYVLVEHAGRTKASQDVTDAYGGTVGDHN